MLLLQNHQRRSKGPTLQEKTKINNIPCSKMHLLTVQEVKSRIGSKLLYENNEIDSNLCCQAEYAVHCPTSLGPLLLVYVEAPHNTASVWFCSKVSVTTPEGGVSLFPCYRFVSCSTLLALRDSIGQWYNKKTLF